MPRDDWKRAANSDIQRRATLEQERDEAHEQRARTFLNTFGKPKRKKNKAKRRKRKSS